jgi:hypothetical protein
VSSCDLADDVDAATARLVFVSPPCTAHGKPALRPLETPFRACELCTHATAREGRVLCGSPAARLGGQLEALDVARSVSGSCGPNARHLDMPGWH